MSAHTLRFELDDVTRWSDVDTVAARLIERYAGFVPAEAKGAADRGCVATLTPMPDQDVTDRRRRIRYHAVVEVTV